MNMTDPSSNSSAFGITSTIMVSAVIVFFMVMILIFLLHLYARCLWASTPEDPEIVSWRRQLARQNRPQRGLKSSALKSLPVSAYNPKEFKDGLECSICLSELQENEKVRILPNCNHGFHLDCIDKWFCSQSTCPICRAPALRDSDSVPIESRQDSIENPAFPTNVLYWGDETQVRTSQELEEEGVSSQSLVIDIPTVDESCSSSSTARVGDEEEEVSPMMNRMKSLKRLLSRGKRVAPSPCSSSSGFGEVEQV